MWVKRPNVFDKVMPKVKGLEQEEEDTSAKLETANAKTKQKAAATVRPRKKGIAIWTPILNEKVLVRTPPMSAAITGMTSKLMYIFEGPC